MKSPILYIIFNRPKITQKAFEAIRAAKPPRLYVSADGPRLEKGEKEKALCEETRQLATNIDWPCELKILFHEKNLGCQKATITAMNWFFDNEPEGIILEDDIMPLPSFFDYCDELLELYRNNESIFTISGTNYISKYYTPKHSYFFSNITHAWGWASWRRAWKYYDAKMKDWPSWRDSEGLSRVSNGNLHYKIYCKNILDNTYKGLENTWDYQWGFTCWKMNGLVIHPKHNLTLNLGIGDPDAVHTTTSCNDLMQKFPPKEIEFPLIHPTTISRDVVADSLIIKSIIKNTHFYLFKCYIKKIPIVGNLLRKMSVLIKRFYITLLHYLKNS